MKFITDLSPDLNDIKFFEDKLFQYNLNKIENYNYKDFIVKVMDESLFIGGIHCQIGGGWLYISGLWIEDDFRLIGVGEKLLKKAEDIAKENSCIGVYLYTYSFQNPGFYEKYGYEVFGELEKFCNNHSKYYMKKYLN